MWFSFAKFVAKLKRNMENQRPLILISNDDGIIAKGISELIKFLRPLGEIVAEYCTLSVKCSSNKPA